MLGSQVRLLATAPIFPTRRYMKQKTSFSAVRWSIQGVLLIGALVSVIFLIRSLRQSNDKLNLDEIFEDQEASWSWCPPGGEVKIEVLFQALDQVRAEDVCEVITRPVRIEQIEAARWRPLLRATGGHPAEEKVLEGDLEQGVFRTQGLPFHSPMLREHLKAISSP